MYVRTNKGQIFDCIESEQMGKPIYYPKKSKTNGYIDYNEVYKKSNNIIDICEVGDYVNGYKITDFEDDGKIILGNEEQLYGIYENQIKTIVTREQFSQMEYKVKE